MEACQGSFSAWFQLLDPKGTHLVLQGTFIVEFDAICVIWIPWISTNAIEFDNLPRFLQFALLSHYTCHYHCYFYFEVCFKAYGSGCRYAP